MSETPAPQIVTPQGKPASPAEKPCANCGKGLEFRKPQKTFGGEKYHCINCGGDW
jgi:predicted RNA-binding Zn-ribbon protein involved in translation (DUF1610 family)